MTILLKILFLLSSSQKKSVVKLSILVLVGMVMEIAGLGLIIPVFSILLNEDAMKGMTFLVPIFDTLGNPTHMQLVVGSMVFLIAVYLLKTLFLGFLSWKQSSFTWHLSADLASRLYRIYLSQPYAFHLNRNSAVLSHTVLDEVTRFTTITQAIIFLQTEISMMIGIAFALILIEPLGAISITCFMILCAALINIITRKKIQDWGNQRKYNSELKSVNLLQGLGGIKDLKLLGREDYFHGRFNSYNKAYANVNTKVSTFSLIPRLYLELMAVIGLVGLIALMLWQGRPLDMLVPVLSLFAASAFRMIPSVNRILVSVQSIKFGTSIIDGLYNEFKQFDELPQIKPASTFIFENEISIENLVFKYPFSELTSLQNVSLKIQKGKTVGLIGPSGSGKSTLIDLILGLLSPESGAIKVDSCDISTNLRQWQNQIGYVPQTIFLTDDTLRNNIAFGIPENEIDEKVLINAYRAANLEEFVLSLPEGLNTNVGERGTRLSGGQKQRIGIARALYNDPSVLVLDEATSALDTNSELNIMESVTRLKGQKTIIIVAHRLSTLEHCDWIYRLKDGKICDQGSPEKMLQMAGQGHK